MHINGLGVDRIIQIRNIAYKFNTSNKTRITIIDGINNKGYKIVETNNNTCRGYVSYKEKIIAVNFTKNYGKGLNFVLAHELGHIILDHNKRDTVKYKSSSYEIDQHMYSPQFEKEANYFAAFSLVPDDFYSFIVEGNNFISASNYKKIYQQFSSQILASYNCFEIHMETLNQIRKLYG